MSEDVSPGTPNPYAASNPYPYTQTAPQERPGRTLGIIGFILSFIWILDVVGLIISSVGMSQSRRAGQKNGFALAGIIISIVGILSLGTILAFAIPALVGAGQECARLGNGTHVVGNSTYTCTPTSFKVYTN
jgi:hypothetical protein